MKIVYCHCSLYNPGGMERVLLNKVHWLKRNTDWEITIVTTDQGSRPSFYKLPDGVRLVDLDINYSSGNNLSVLGKTVDYLRKRSLHKRRLTELLMNERPDVTVSLFPYESSFIPSIKDGSKKVLELHFNRYFRIQYGRKGLLGCIDRLRSMQDKHIAKKFDSFVVLTEEDRTYWGKIKNILVIPNAAIANTKSASECNEKRVIAVGRLDYQKGFDRLIESWEKIQQDGRFTDWRLDIFGQGEWQQRLQEMIDTKGLSKYVKLNRPTSQIFDEYRKSSIHVMSSHYEGFPMVMIEAMSSGLPEVTFDFKCGPKDIIEHNLNGIIVEEGDTDALAQSLMALMEDDVKRRAMGREALKVTTRFSEERIMKKWCDLFTYLSSDKR